MIGGLLPLVILGAIGYGLFRLLSGRIDPTTGQSIEGDAREMVTRLFRLGLLAVAVVLVAEGVASLVEQILPSTGDELGRDPLVIAQALSFTIVGVPVVVGMAWWTRNQLEGNPDEYRSAAWAAYLGGMLVVAVIMAMVAVNDVLAWATASEEFSGRTVGQALSWSAVGAVHWILNRRRPLVDRSGRPEARTPIYLLAVSAIGLAAGGYGAWRLLRAALRPLSDAAFGEVMAAGAGDLARAAIAPAAVGLAAWIWFWWLHGRTSVPGRRWYAYVLLVGVLSGLVTALSSMAVLLHSVLQWFFGDPRSATAAVHFESAPGSLSAAVIGVLIWSHHRAILGRAAGVPAGAEAEYGAEADEQNEPVDRIYDHLVAFAALVVSAVGAGMLLAAGFEALAQTALAGQAVSNAVVLAVTFLVLGVPLWLRFWRRSQQRVAADPSETQTVSRRVHLIGSVGVAAATTLITLVITLTILFEEMADRGVTSDTLFRLRYPLGFLLSALVVLAYHLVVYRRDRALAPPPPPAPPAEPAPVPPAASVVKPPLEGVEVPGPFHERHLTVVSDLANGNQEAVVASLGWERNLVTLLRVPGAGTSPTDEQLEQARLDLDDLDADQVLVTIRHGRIEVEPILEGV